MSRIRIVKNLRTNNGWIRAGEEMEARILPGGIMFEVGRPYQVIEGEFSGYEIPQTHAITIPKEKLYTEQQYNVLTTELQRLREEKRLLQKEIDELITSGKVPLPRKVAEALNHYRNKCKFSYSAFASIFFRQIGRGDNDYTIVLKNFIAIGLGDRLITALVNGYTIEETTQERIKRVLGKYTKNGQPFRRLAMTKKTVKTWQIV